MIKKSVIILIILLVAILVIESLILLPYLSDRDNSNNLISLKLTSSNQEDMPSASVKYNNEVIYENIPEVNYICKSCHNTENSKVNNEESFMAVIPMAFAIMDSVYIPYLKSEEYNSDEYTSKGDSIEIISVPENPIPRS